MRSPSLRRSCLAVPASSERMMEKGAASGADQVFFDLEDACAPEEKVPARAAAARALQSLDFGATCRAVRVNDVTTPWCHGDIVDVVSTAGAGLDTIVVPKVENASQVHFVHHLLDAVERSLTRDAPIALELQIESPSGAANLREICRASPRTTGIVFGPGDYAAALGVFQPDIGMVDERYPGHQWHWVMSEIAVHARAAGLDAIDGPYVDFKDEAGYRDSATRAKLLGFDGKWCIHPAQIPWANDVFAPAPHEIERAERIVDAYDQAIRNGTGAIALDGKLVDEATRKVAEATLARARMAGLRGATE